MTGHYKKVQGKLTRTEAKAIFDFSSHAVSIKVTSPEDTAQSLGGFL